MTSKPQLPASIANASREELQKLLVETLKKLKVRDKKIEDLNRLLKSEEVATQKPGVPSSSLEATVQALEAKLLSSEEEYKRRLEAETENLNAQISNLQSNLSSEQSITLELQDQLGRREYQLGKLQEKESELETNILELNQQLQEVSAAAATERCRAQDFEQKLLAAEKRAKMAEENAADTTAHGELQQKVANLSQMCSTLERHAEENEQKWARMQKQLQGELEESNNSASGATQRAQAAETEAKRLTDELEAVCGRHLQAQESIKTLQNEIERLRSDASALTANAEQQRTRLVGEVDRLSMELAAALESASAGSASLQEQVAEMSSQLQRKSAAETSLLQQLQNVQGELHEKDAQLQDLNSTAGSTHRIVELETKLADHARQLQAAKSQSEADISRLQLANEAAKQRVEELDALRAAAEQRVESLLADLKQASLAAKKNEAQVEQQTQGQIAQLLADKDALQREAAALQQEMEELMQSVSTSKQQLTAAEEAIAALTSSAAEMKSFQDELQDAKQKADAAEAEAEAETLRQKLTAAAASSAVMEDLQNEIVASKQEAERTAAELVAAKRDAEEAKQLVGSLERQLQDTQDANQAIAEDPEPGSLQRNSELESKLQDAAADARGAHDRAALLEQQLLQTSVEQEALQERIASLERLQMAEEQAAYAATASAEAGAEQLESLEKKLSLAEQNVAASEAEVQQLKQQLELSASEESLLPSVESLQLQVGELSNQRSNLQEKLQKAESLIVTRDSALQDLTNRLEEEKACNTEKLQELRALQKQMQMELDQAEDELRKLHEECATLKTQRQDQNHAQPPDVNAGKVASRQGATEEQLAELRSQVERLQHENGRLLEAEQQTAAELAQRLVEIANRGQTVAEQRVDQRLLQGAIQTVQAHVSELEETLHLKEEEMAALEEELASLRGTPTGPADNDGDASSKAGTSDPADASAQLDQLQEKVASLEAQLQAAEQQLEAAKAMAAEDGSTGLQGEVTSLKAELKQAAELQQRLATAEEQLAAAAADAEKWRDQVASLEEQLGAATLESSNAASRLMALELELQEAHATEDSPAEVKRIADLEAQLEEAAAAAQAAKERVVELETGLQQDSPRDAPESSSLQLQQQVAELEKALTTVRAELAGREVLIEQLKQQTIDLAATKEPAAGMAEPDVDSASLASESSLSAAPGTPRASGSLPAASDDVAYLKAERDKLQKELNEAKRKFVLVAKKKQQEFAAKSHDLESRLVASEAAQKELEMQLAQARSQRANALSLLESSKDLQRVRQEVEAKDEAMQKLQQQLTAAKQAVAELELQQARNAEMAEKESELTRQLEASQAEAGRVRKEQEAERSRVKRAVAEMKKKIESLQKERQSAAVEAAEARGKASAELTQMKSELSAAEHQVQQAKEEISRLETELKDYKARAHALLRAKAAEVQSAKDAARDELKGALESAELRAVHAEEQLRQLSEQLKEVRASMGADLAAASSRHESEAGRLRMAEAQAVEATEAAKRAYDQLKLRYESLEARLHAVQQQLAEVQHRAGGAEELQQRLEEVQGEHAALRDHTRAASEAKDAVKGPNQHGCMATGAELSRLLECNASLRDELTALRARAEQLQRSATLESGLGVNGGSGGLHHTERSLSVGTSVSRLGEYGRGGAASDVVDMDSMLESGSVTHLVALAERDKMLNVAHRRAAELESEVAELERECQLRQAQESALKEAVRDLQREIERLRLPGKASDIEYLKNVLLKMYETGEAESLLPVVATILKLSPAEVEHCKEGIKKNKLERRSSTALQSAESEGDVGSYISGWASWLGSGS